MRRGAQCERTVVSLQGRMMGEEKSRGGPSTGEFAVGVSHDPFLVSHWIPRKIDMTDF